MAVAEVRWSRWLALTLLSFTLVLLPGCGGSSSPTAPPTPTPEPPVGLRDRLTVDELFSATPPGVVHNAYFQPLGERRTSANSLCGTLRFAETPMDLSLIHISEPTRRNQSSRMPSSA